MAISDSPATTGGPRESPLNISAYLVAFILAIALFVPQEAKEAKNEPALLYSHPTPSVLSQEEPPPVDVKEYAVYRAARTGLPEDLIQNLIRCESEWKLDAIGDQGASYGILQFKAPTFELFSKKYGLIGLSIKDPYHQIDLAAQMIADGYILHWKNCGKKLGLIK